MVSGKWRSICFPLVPRITGDGSLVGHRKEESIHFNFEPGIDKYVGIEQRILNNDSRAKIKWQR